MDRSTQAKSEHSVTTVPENNSASAKPLSYFLNGIHFNKRNLRKSRVLNHGSNMNTLQCISWKGCYSNSKDLTNNESRQINCYTKQQDAAWVSQQREEQCTKQEFSEPLTFSSHIEEYFFKLSKALKMPRKWAENDGTCSLRCFFIDEHAKYICYYRALTLI